jgi:hypothetical protein
MPLTPIPPADDTPGKRAMGAAALQGNADGLAVGGSLGSNRVRPQSRDELVQERGNHHIHNAERQAVSRMWECDIAMQ